MGREGSSGLEETPIPGVLYRLFVLPNFLCSVFQPRVTR